MLLGVSQELVGGARAGMGYPEQGGDSHGERGETAQSAGGPTQCGDRDCVLEATGGPTWGGERRMSSRVKLGLVVWGEGVPWGAGWPGWYGVRQFLSGL